MASKTLERIVHFRMMPSGLVAYQADIEADKFRAEKTIHFSGPFEVFRDVGKYCSPPYAFSHAIFDYNTHSVVWLSKGKPEEESGMSCIWHITDHYNLEYVEKTCIPIQHSSIGRPSILPDAGFTSIIGTESLDWNYAAQMISLAQKGSDDNKWHIVGRTPLGDLTQESELFRGTTNDTTKAAEIGLLYVLNIRVTRSGEIFVDEMKYHNPFQNLRTEKDALWKSFKIQCRYNYLNSEQRAWFMTTNYSITEADKTAGTGHPHRFYMCKIEAGSHEHDHCTVNVEWITLRADGSIDSTSSVVKPQSHEPYVCEFDAIPKGLRILALADNKTFVVIWQACYPSAGSDGHSILVGLTFQVAEDGAVPSPKDWQRIRIKNQCAFSKPDDAMTTTVLVPGDFALA